MESGALLVSLAPGVAAGSVACTDTASAEQNIASIAANGAGKLWIKSDVDCYIIFGVLGSVTTPTTSNAQWMTGGLDHLLDLLATQTAFKVLRKGSTSGTVSWVKAA